jgi:hypothetical protein
MVPNTLCEFGPELWTLSNHHVQLNCGFNIETAVDISDEQAMDYRKLRDLKYREKRLRLLTCLYKGVATRVLGVTFKLICSPAYHRWLDHMRSNWLPVLPTTDPDPQGTSYTQISSAQAPSSPSSPDISSLRMDAEAPPSSPPPPNWQATIIGADPVQAPPILVCMPPFLHLTAEYLTCPPGPSSRHIMQSF